MRFGVTLLGLIMLALSAIGQAAELAQAPLSAGTRADPNLMFIIDDSGSMRFEIMPESHIAASSRFLYPRPSSVYEGYGGGSYANIVPSFDDPFGAYSRSPQTNALYYDPSVTYRPWMTADGSRMAPANPRSARHNPSRPVAGGRNLTVATEERADGWVGDCRAIGDGGPVGCEPVLSYERVCGRFGCYNRQTQSYAMSFFPALYFMHEGGDYNDLESYRRVEIRPSSAPFEGDGRDGRSDCANADASVPSCSYEEEIQNFANWYTYYRSRTLAARAGIGEAFSQLDESIRIGFDTINSGGSITRGGVQQGVRAFSGEGRATFFERLYAHDVPAAGTPLRRGLQRSGSYFEQDDEPWRDDPASNQRRDFQSCRASYALLMTDGYWSGDSPYFIGNADGEDGSQISGPGGQSFRYRHAPPYADTVSPTLADVAMHFWKRDLRPNMTNDVPVNAQDPAFWQHMTTFGVGFGVQGEVDPDDAWRATSNGGEIDWPGVDDFNSGDESRSDRARLDDLVHASVNGHGGFFNAANPQAFLDGLDRLLGAIVSRQDSSTVPVAVNSDTIGPDARLIEAGFRSTDWSGELRGYRLLSGERRELVWDAGQLLRERPEERRLLTWGGRDGATLGSETGDLDADQLRWLRGASVEGLRSRVPEGQSAPNLLGDIVNSEPFLLSPPEGSERPGMVFVGANDGMLHGFSAESGQELFGYLPSELILAESQGRGRKRGQGQAPIEALMEPSYLHQYFVDGSPTARNVDIADGPAAVVVGTQGAGGRSVFALDVSDPGDMTAEDVLWEFTHEALGEGVTHPSISRIDYRGEPRWVAIFGNGYNSASHQATLFVVDLQSGELLKRFDTGVGNKNAPNGLAPPAVTRWPSYDRNSHFAYAGDQQGNMWRFDLSDLSSEPEKLLAGSEQQPITARPQLEFKPGDPRTLVVMFGTGSYQFSADRNDRHEQRLYGLMDRGENSPSPIEADEADDLLIEQRAFPGSSAGRSIRTVRPTNAVRDTSRGWYLRLPEGERMVSMPTLPSGIYHQRALFSTLRPPVGQCTAGVDGFVYSLRIDTGGGGSRAFFDVNRDGIVDDADNLAISGDSVEVVAGVALGSGQSQVVMTDPETGEGVLAGSIGNAAQRTGISPSAAGRQSWRQIFEP